MEIAEYPEENEVPLKGAGAFKDNTAVVMQGETDGVMQEKADRPIQGNVSVNVQKNDTEVSEKQFNPSIKIISEFKNSVLKNDANINEFISAYLKDQGISKNSIKGKQLITDLKEFFNELKEFNSLEIKNLMQNGSEARGFNFGNIKQFIREDPKPFNEFKKIIYDLEQRNETSNEKQSVGKDINIFNLSKAENDNKDVTSMTDKNIVYTKLENIDLGKHVHNEIDSKISEMKNIISKMIKENNADSPIFEKVMAAINNNINDFKVFNSISNGYYYMDVPVNFAANEYNCKLIVKDDRQSGKKLDSTNIKIAASVNTINMGIVDAFINVKNKIVNVDIKAEAKFTKNLSTAKKILISKLDDKGYIINLNIKEKAHDEKLDIVSSRKFFNDDSISAIDTRV